MIQTLKTLQNNYWGLFRYFQQEVENSRLFFRFAASTESQKQSPLCACPCTHSKAYQRRLWASSKSSHQARQSQDWACIYAHGGGGGACFLMEFANRFRLTRSDHNFHLETIFSNMSHILKNRFRCLELVQNSCKKCSVQMKKISLQCLLLSTFFTE